MKPGLTEQDRSIWEAYSRHVRPLAGQAAAAAVAAEPPPGPAASPARAPALRQRSIPTAPFTLGDQPGGLDSATWNRLRSGKLAPTRSLDLHGRTAQRAFRALHAFLNAAQAEGIRCVEIITGRGSGETGGVLKRELPEWLNRPDLRPLILAAVHPHPANPGAVRVLLRRSR
jgi:DNA-nicking Smr family endonuclease